MTHPTPTMRPASLNGADLAFWPLAAGALAAAAGFPAMVVAAGAGCLAKGK